jgi:hypothetical protein
MLLAALLLLTFILCNSSGLAGVDIHDVPIFPAADVISDVNGVPAVVGLLAFWLHFYSITNVPHFSGVPTVLTVLLFLSFLLLLAFLLFRTFMLN